MTPAFEPRSLVLELTESMAMENPTGVKSLLMQLRSIGVRISIDDFGTGYSSLAHLRQFPVDALKIDRSFVRGIETREDSAAIVGALTDMALQLGLHVVAEGVENEQQLALLRFAQVAMRRRVICSQSRLTRPKPPKSCVPGWLGEAL